MLSDNTRGTNSPSSTDKVNAMEEQAGSLRSNEQKFSSMFDLAPGIMTLTSVPEGLFLEVNREFLKTFGFSREEVAGKTADELRLWVNPDEHHRYQQILLENGHVTSFTATLRTKSGDLMVVRFSGSLLNIAGERSALNTIVDCTGQTSTEQTFPENEGRFRSFFEQSSDAFLILDDGLFVDCNNAAMQLLGYDDKHCIASRSMAELSPELQPDGTPSMEKAKEIIASVFSEGSHRFEWTYLKADGSELPVEVSLTPMFSDGKWVMHVIWRDISERKQVELREQTRLDILGKMASGASLPCLLNDIVTFVEKNSPGAICSILVANAECTRLYHGAAPSLTIIMKRSMD
jgi:PAS domain S-box-containing protein